MSKNKFDTLLSNFEMIIDASIIQTLSDSTNEVENAVEVYTYLTKNFKNTDQFATIK